MFMNVLELLYRIMVYNEDINSSTIAYLCSIITNKNKNYNKYKVYYDI